jgi:hypothetical protein
MAAQVAAPRKAHEGDAGEPKCLEQRRDQVDQRLRLVTVTLAWRCLAEARRIEGEHSQAVAVREQPANLVQEQARARREAHAVQTPKRRITTILPRLQPSAGVRSLGCRVLAETRQGTARMDAMHHTDVGCGSAHRTS